jgi:hypothetical protein
MTAETSEPTSLASARAQLDALCRKVGLKLVDALPEEAGRRMPNDVSLWSSAYAQLLLWPCGGNDARSIELAAESGQGWFDEVLTKGERVTCGRPIDGYLVIALTGEPDQGAMEDVRRLELSSQVCRKHLIWPSKDDDEVGQWLRVADVTVVGLPDAGTAGGSELYWPEIDSEAQAIWNDLAELGVPATVIKDETE